MACVDGRLRSSKVLEMAVRAARVLKTTLRIVHVEPGRPVWKSDETPRSHGRDVLRNAVLSAQQMAPDLVVTQDLLTREPVATALADSGADAELLVLGAHRREGRPGTLASVLAHAQCNVVLAHAQCNVMIAR